MGKAIAIGEAKTNFSRLVQKVEDGEEVVIRRGPKPVAKLIPFAAEETKPLFGALRGQVQIGEDFDEPIPGFEPYS